MAHQHIRKGPVSLSCVNNFLDNLKLAFRCQATNKNSFPWCTSVLHHCSLPFCNTTMGDISTTVTEEHFGVQLAAECVKASGLFSYIGPLDWYYPTPPPRASLLNHVDSFSWVQCRKKLSLNLFQTWVLCLFVISLNAHGVCFEVGRLYELFVTDRIPVLWGGAVSTKHCTLMCISRNILFNPMLNPPASISRMNWYYGVTGRSAGTSAKQKVEHAHHLKGCI